MNVLGESVKFKIKINLKYFPFVNHIFSQTRIQISRKIYIQICKQIQVIITEGEKFKVKKNQWIVCEKTRSKLAQLEIILKKSFKKTDSTLYEKASYLIEHKGKRLRPALLLLAAQFGNSDDSRLLKAAKAIELVHTATLYHDDIMDRASMRRGELSFNNLWGNKLASIAGVFLFAEACKTISSFDKYSNIQFSKGMVDLCVGQLQETENAYNIELSELEHLEILSRKTAPLFQLSCTLGSHLSKALPKYKETLEFYGYKIGIVFQLIDNILDLIGKNKNLGKQTEKDLYEGIYSLPVLRVFQNKKNGDQLKSILLKSELTKEDIKEAKSLIIDSGTIEYTYELIYKYVSRLEKALNTLPDKPARESLFNLTEYVVKRIQ